MPKMIATTGVAFQAVNYGARLWCQGLATASASYIFSGVLFLQLYKCQITGRVAVYGDQSFWVGGTGAAAVQGERGVGF